MISFIFAMSRNRVIGINNDLPWHLPRDMKRFRTLTRGKPVVMGRKTWDSIGHPLPKRPNFVLTRDTTLILPECEVLHTIEAVKALQNNYEEIMLLGGADIFRLFMNDVERIYLTEIHADIDGDIFFPSMDWSSWVASETETFSADEKHAYSFSFMTLERPRHDI